MQPHPPFPKGKENKKEKHFIKYYIILLECLQKERKKEKERVFPPSP
jgi:hypothetical protein